MSKPKITVVMDKTDEIMMKRFQTATQIKKRCQEKLLTKIDDPASTDIEILDSFRDWERAHHLRHSIWMSFDKKERPEF